MKRNLSIPEHAFVTIVGVAAFIHSAWTIATFSGGVAPEVHGGDPGTAIITLLGWLWWAIPGALSAFALEVGQVVTARQIKSGVGRKVRIGFFTLNVKTLTFILLSAATYLLQLAYLQHHYPALPVSLGLPADDVAGANMTSRIIVWGMPLLLPLTMLFFTAGDEAQERAQYPLTSHVAPIVAKCPQCEWCKEYSDPIAAQNALNGHMRAHSLLPLAETNGKH